MRLRRPAWRLPPDQRQPAARHLSAQRGAARGRGWRTCAPAAACSRWRPRSWRASVTAVDISRRAVLTARLNARLNGVRVRALRGDLLAPVAGEGFDLIVSNPPYVPAETRHAASRAPCAGLDGLAFRCGSSTNACRATSPACDPSAQDRWRRWRPSPSATACRSCTGRPAASWRSCAGPSTRWCSRWAPPSATRPSTWPSSWRAAGWSPWNAIPRARNRHAISSPVPAWPTAWSSWKATRSTPSPDWRARSTSCSWTRRRASTRATSSWPSRS